VIAFVDVHLADRITLADLAGAAGLHFAAQFRVATGVGLMTLLFYSSRCDQN